MQRIHTHTENEFFYARLGRCHTLDFSLLLDLTAVDQVFLIKNISAAFQRVLMYLTMSAASKIQKYYSFKWELKDKRNLINQHTYCSTFITSSICSKDCLKLKCRTNNQIGVWDIMQTSCIISLCIRCYFWLWQCVLCTLAYVNQRIFVKHMNSSVSYECKLCLYLHSWGPFWTINVVGLGSWVVGKGGLGVPKLWVGGYKKLLETKIQITTRKVSKFLRTKILRGPLWMPVPSNCYWSTLFQQTTSTPDGEMTKVSSSDSTTELQAGVKNSYVGRALIWNGSSGSFEVLLFQLYICWLAFSHFFPFPIVCICWLAISERTVINSSEYAQYNV